MDYAKDEQTDSFFDTAIFLFASEAYCLLIIDDLFPVRIEHSCID